MPPPKTKPRGRETIGGMLPLGAEGSTTGGIPPPNHRVKGITGSSASGMPLMHSATGRTAATVTGSSSGGMPPKHRATGKATAAGKPSSREIPLANPSNVMGSSVPRRVPPGINGSSATTVPHRVAADKKHTGGRSNSTSSPRVSSLPRARSNTFSPRDSSLRTGTPQKHRVVTPLKGETPKKLGGALSREMPKKDRQKRTLQCKELTAVETRLAEEMIIKEKQEADRVIQQLNELGLGEDISNEELQSCYELLPCEHPCVETYKELDDELLHKLEVCHISYRIKYYKFKRQGQMNESCDAKSEDDWPLYLLDEKLKCFDEGETNLNEDHIMDYLNKEGLLRHIECDRTFDWAFHYCMFDGLDDYQRIVPKNYGGCEYPHWDVYREYFHKYEIEREYLEFWEKLSNKLKWMEDYIIMDWSSLKWERIRSRGVSQAIKIATGFSKITKSLARVACDECIYSMNVDLVWYKELDGVYFQIWKLVTNLKKSFREALSEVHESNMFPFRRPEMSIALESEGSEMEREFHNVTAGITEGVPEGKARKIIADAVTDLKRRPKYYATYIRRKMDIARAIEVIPTESP